MKRGQLGSPLGSPYVTQSLRIKRTSRAKASADRYIQAVEVAFLSSLFNLLQCFCVLASIRNAHAANQSKLVKQRCAVLGTNRY
jgi:hypothetical protein